MIPTYASCLNGNWSGNMELFCVQWNVPIETGLLTVMGKLIKQLKQKSKSIS